MENGVGLVMRLFRWVYRHHRFRSVGEINEALAQITFRINERPHSRFRTSRRARFEASERAALRPLPEIPFEQIEWKKAKVHPDCTVSVEGAYYSVPFIHRGKEVRVKLTPHQIEIFVGLERVALHARDRSRSGARRIETSHLPPNSRAYLETTPQALLSQARFISTPLHGLIDELFSLDALAHLRRVQGFLRHARDEIARFGRSDAEPRIALAVEQMRRFDRARVTYFSEQLAVIRKQRLPTAPEREIERIPGNPMLRRYTPAGVIEDVATHPPAGKGTMSYEPDPSEVSIN